VTPTTGYVRALRFFVLVSHLASSQCSHRFTQYIFHYIYMTTGPICHRQPGMTTGTCGLHNTAGTNAPMASRLSVLTKRRAWAPSFEFLRRARRSRSSCRAPPLGMYGANGRLRICAFPSERRCSSACACALQSLTYCLVFFSIPPLSCCEGAPDYLSEGKRITLGRALDHV